MSLEYLLKLVYYYYIFRRDQYNPDKAVGLGDYVNLVVVHSDNIHANNYHSPSVSCSHILGPTSEAKWIRLARNLFCSGILKMSSLVGDIVVHECKCLFFYIIRSHAFCPSMSAIIWAQFWQALFNGPMGPVSTAKSISSLLVFLGCFWSPF